MLRKIADPCRLLGGKGVHASARPLPPELIPRHFSVRTGRRESAPVERPVRACVKRYFLSMGESRVAHKYEWESPPRGYVHPRPTVVYLVRRGNGEGFAAFADVVEAACYARSLTKWAGEGKAVVEEVRLG